MLTSFVPTKGPHSGATYTFAREMGDIQRGGQMDENSIVRLENADGSYDMTGTDRLFIDRGTITATFDMNEWWLTNGGMGNYVSAAGGSVFGARDKALIDLMQYCVMGGQGRLTNTMADGTVLWANAKVNTWSVTYMAGAGTVRPQLGFIVLSGFWTMPDNSLVPIF